MARRASRSGKGKRIRQCGRDAAWRRLALRRAVFEPLEQRLLLSNTPVLHYLDNFEGTPPPNGTWSGGTITLAYDGTDNSGFGGTAPPLTPQPNHYLAGGGGLTLSVVPGMPYVASFSLYCINAWAGNSGPNFQVTANNAVVFSSNFANSWQDASYPGYTQAYGGGNGQNAPGTGSSGSYAIDNDRHQPTGYNAPYPGCYFSIADTVYSLTTQPFTSVNGQLTLSFSLNGVPPSGPPAYPGTQYPGGNAQVGLDNVKVDAVGKVPDVCKCTCQCKTKEPVKESAPANAQDPAANTVSPQTGVDLSNGAVTASAEDLSSNAASPWGGYRSYSTQGIGGQNGNGWMVSQEPYLVQGSSFAADGTVNGNSIAEVFTANDIRWFDSSDQVHYTARYFLQDTLTMLPNGTFAMDDSSGGVAIFGAFGMDGIAHFSSYTDVNGVVTSVNGSEIRQSVGNTVVSYLYTYTGGQVASIVLRHSADGGGTWTYEREVDYAYGVGQGERALDLTTATLRVGNPTQGLGAIIGTTYYRYYTAADGPANDIGDIKFVFNPPSYARMIAAGINPMNVTPANDSSLLPYADAYYTYDNNNHVTSAVVQGYGCSCGGATGQGTYLYSWAPPGSVANPLTTNDYNTPWETVTETEPDGSTTRTITTNVYQEVMSDSYSIPNGGGSSATAYSYDSQGRESTVTLPTGVTDTYVYSNGYLSEIDQSGPSGSQPVEAFTYQTQTVAGSGNTPTQSVTLMSSDTLYGATGYGDPRTTSYTYGFATVNGNPTTRVQVMGTTLPSIGSGQNGSGANQVQVDYYDSLGRVVWSQDPDNHFSYTAYDVGTGAVSETIADVNYNSLGSALQQSFTTAAAAVNAVMGTNFWTNPTTGLNLVTGIVPDALGRPHEIVDPEGRTTVIAYNDADHRVTTYPGYNLQANTTTGPIEVQREDWAGGYVDTLTMIGTPILGSDNLPAGTENLANYTLESFSRQIVNVSGQTIERDDYFTLTNLTWTNATAQLGAATASNDSSTGYYHKTLYEYDDNGNLERTQEPTGTIVRTVWDGLNRPTSVWVGTNDVTGNGNEWSPTNQGTANLVDVADYVYDNGHTDPKQVTYHRRSSNIGDEVVQYLYDSRDQLVAEKDGVLLNSDGSLNLTGETGSGVHRPIFTWAYDNLGEVVEADRFDGDGIAISATPSSSRRQQKTTYAYDDQGRVFQQQVYSVDSSGNATLPLTSNFYYDNRGDLIANYEPGGLAYKSVFDGAGRDVVDYVSDGGALNAGGFTVTQPSYFTANNVNSDVVLSETDRTYDGSDNVIETVTRQRFHNDSTAATGALGTPTSGVGARVYYGGSWYDAASRLIAQADVGTNTNSSGTPQVWTRPTTAPTSSTDTLLLTQYGYGSNGFVSSMTDPRGVVTAYTTDALGRTSQQVADSGGIGQTTQWTYDGLGDTLTVNAIDGSTHQKTKYVYGTSSTSGVFSNDLLSQIQFPDKSSGDPSSAASDDQSFTYDALGEAVTFTDQNGTTHTYTLDPLGRLTLDGVTTFGSGVNNAVKSLGYSFDPAGRPYQQTSYNVATNPTASNIINQVQDAYNGYGQLTSEYQAHTSAVNTSTSPQVQYVYAQGPNASLLSGMVYPNGRALDYVYGSQLSLSGITFSGTTATATSSTPLPSGLAAGAQVTISGATPSTYDGTFAVTGVSGSTFTYTLSTTPSGNATGNDITAVLSPQVPVSAMSSTFAGSITTVTVTTALPHGLSSGANVTIAGSGQSVFNGTFSVTVTSPTQFTYTINNVNIAEGSDSGKDIIATTDAFSSLDSSIGRVTGLFDHLGTSGGTPLESYNYLGTDGIVVRNRPQNQTQLTYVQQPGDTLTSTDGGDQYTGLDRFGRIIDQNWINTVSGTPTDRFQSWYDRGGNPLYKSIVGLGSTAAGFSELYHASGGADSTAYDNLNRIQSFSRGTLSHSNSANVDPSGRQLADTVSSPSKSQSWTLDQLGNWSSFASTGSTTQSRVFNTRNQITTGTTGLTIPTYNNNGDMTKDQTGITYTYDAWDRMVTSTASGGEIFAYDADGRRPALTICSNTITDSYYSIDWQVLQENSRSTGAVLDQYVWGLGYVDDLILRDDNSTSGSYGKPGSGLGRRVYAQQDANFNVTSLEDVNGNVLERFVYDPYGSVTVLSSSWGNRGDGYSWVYLFQGLRYDPNTKLYNARTRDYNPSLGVWVEPDQIGYGDGMNLYQAFASDPMGSVDAFGLAAMPAPTEADRTVTQAMRDAVQDMKNENWRPPPPGPYGPDSGAFGKELERRVFIKLRAKKGFSLNVCVSKKTNTVVSIDKSGVVKGSTQVDIVASQEGYAPEVGKPLDPNKTTIYDLKTAAAKKVMTRDQAGRLRSLSNDVKVVRPEELYQEGKWVANKWVQRVGAVFAILGAADSMCAIIGRAEYDYEFDQMARKIEYAKSRQNPDDRFTASLDAMTAVRDYMSHFMPASTVSDLLYGGAVYQAMSDYLNSGE